MNTEQIRPLLPHDTVFLPTDTGMYLRRNERVVSLTGKGIHPMFLRLAPLLDGTRTLDALTAGLPAAHAEAVTRMLTTLIGKQVLIARAQDDHDLLAPAEHARYGAQLAFLEHLVATPCAAFLRFRTARIYLDGDGAACRAAGKALLRNGAGHLYLAPGIDAGVAAELATFAAAHADGAQVMALDEPFADAQARLAFDHACYVSDRPDFGALAELSRQAAAAGVAVFPAVTIAGAARLGPLPAVDGPGCWHCAFLRLLDQLPAAVAAPLWRGRALGERWLDDAQHDGAPLLQVMGNGLAFRVFQHACGIAADGHVLESISALTLESKSAAVLAHPDCPVCAGQASAAPLRELTPLETQQMLVQPEVGVFAGFDDDTLKQVPVFQSLLRRDAATAFPGNSLVSNAQARQQALLAAAVAYTVARGPRRHALLTDARAARTGLPLVGTQQVAGNVGVAGGPDGLPGWLRATGHGQDSAWLLAGADVYAGMPPDGAIVEQPAAGIGAGLAFADARQAALTSLLTHAALRMVADGALAPRPAEPDDGDAAGTAFLALLRQAAPASTIWTLTAGPLTVVLLALDPAGARVLVGAGTSFDAALKAALAEALAVATDGASQETWEDFLPPAAGYGPFQPPRQADAPAHAGLAALAGAGAGERGEVLYCDITPADLAQAGVVVVKATLARVAAGQAEGKEEAVQATLSEQGV